MSDNKILAQVYDAVDLINDQNEEFFIEKSRESVLFGKGGGFTVGLLLLPWIFDCILGFGSAQYLGPNGQQQEIQPEEV